MCRQNTTGRNMTAPMSSMSHFMLSVSVGGVVSTTQHNTHAAGSQAVRQARDVQGQAVSRSSLDTSFKGVTVLRTYVPLWFPCGCS